MMRVEAHGIRRECLELLLRDAQLMLQVFDVVSQQLLSLGGIGELGREGSVERLHSFKRLSQLVGVLHGMLVALMLIFSAPDSLIALSSQLDDGGAKALRDVLQELSELGLRLARHARRNVHILGSSHDGSEDLLRGLYVRLGKVSTGILLLVKSGRHRFDQVL